MESSPWTFVVGRTDHGPNVINSGRPAFPAQAPEVGVDTGVSSSGGSDGVEELLASTNDWRQRTGLRHPAHWSCTQEHLLFNVSYLNSGRPADSSQCPNAKSGGRPAISSFSDDLPAVRNPVPSSSESDSSGDVERIVEMAAVRLRRHCFVRRSRRDWV